MDTKEKQEFIDSIINSVRENLIADLPKVPEDWAGLQLRMWIARRFENQVWRNTLPSEKRNFENDLAVYNL